MTSKDYDVVFTASASHALHLLASSYSPVEGEPNDLSRVHFSFCNHSHTSVVGMRAELRARGATVQSFDRSQVQPAASAAVAEHGTCTAAQHHLVAYPAMCNFSGERYPLDWCGRLKAGELHVRTAPLQTTHVCMHHVVLCVCAMCVPCACVFCVSMITC